MGNLEYKNKRFAKTYSFSRITWDEFYNSEKTVLEQLPFSYGDSILDLGCACGGLGLALKEKFNVSDYTGIDINLPAVQQGQKINPLAKLHHGDILDSKFDNLGTFDKVISLSCIDWNIEYDSMIDRAWRFVSPGGYLIISIKLTDQPSIKDITRAYQHVDGEEIAQYTIININEFMGKLVEFQSSNILANGYWGNVKSNTVSPYDRVCFSVFAVKKESSQAILTKLDLPEEILKCL
jgi:SAM-dependent methyltransferase